MDMMTMHLSMLKNNEMKITLLDEVFYVKEYVQYTEIPHNKSCGCHCGHANFLRKHTYDVNGYCVTPEGLMTIFECHECHQEYRHHFGDMKYNIEEFKENLGIMLHLQKHKKHIK